MRIDTLSGTDCNAAEIENDSFQRDTRPPEKEQVPGFMEEHSSEHCKSGDFPSAAEFPPQREHPKETRPEFPPDSVFM